MVDVNFIYPQDTGYPLQIDQARFESKSRKLINAFFDDWQEVMTPPASIDLLVAANGEMAATLPGGGAITKRETLQEELARLIAEMKKINEK
jgi:hypothetical protein